MRKEITLAMVSLILSTAAAQAQDKPLTGGIQMTHDPSTSVRLTRKPLTTGVAASDFRTVAQPLPLAAQQPQVAPLFNTGAFKGVLNQLKSVAPLKGGVTDWSIPANTQAPYIWYQSALGGYFDGSNTTKDVPRADKLYQYGGKFADGTPVPRDPIYDMNAAGHAFRQEKLNTSHFWSH